MKPKVTNRVRPELLVMLPLVALAACGDSSTGPDDEPFDMHEVEFAPELGVDLGQMEHLGDQLYIQDLEPGDGERVAQAGDSLSVHYTGWIPDGTKFDSSRDRDEPFGFVLHESAVIEGWHLGLDGAEEGGVRRLVIPPALGYGSTGAGGLIPPNSALVFDVELLTIVRDEAAAAPATESRTAGDAVTGRSPTLEGDSEEP